jgi:hypothetical protein
MDHGQFAFQRPDFRGVTGGIPCTEPHVYIKYYTRTWYAPWRKHYWEECVRCGLRNTIQQVTLTDLLPKIPANTSLTPPRQTPKMSAGRHRRADSTPPAASTKSVPKKA